MHFPNILLFEISRRKQREFLIISACNKLALQVPRRLTPPADALSFYTDPATRGYLADPERVAEERLVLAQKYGYDLPDIEEDFLRDELSKNRSARKTDWQ